MLQTSRGKIPLAGKNSETFLLPLIGVQHKPQAKEPQLFAEGLVQTHTVSVRLYESFLADYVGLFF